MPDKLCATNPANHSAIRSSIESWGIPALEQSRWPKEQTLQNPKPPAFVGRPHIFVSSGGFAAPLLSWLDALVKPFGGVVERRDVMGPAFPNANHRNNQKDRRCKPKEARSDPTAGKQGHKTERSGHNQYRELQRQP